MLVVKDVVLSLADMSVLLTNHGADPVEDKDPNLDPTRWVEQRTEQKQVLSPLDDPYHDDFDPTRIPPSN